MLNNIGDIQGEFLVRGNITTTSGFYTDTIINDWTRIAHDFAVGYKKWPFTEGRISTTYVADTSDVGLAYPEGWKADSIRFLQVGGKRLKKVNFYDYQTFREDNVSANDRIFSDFGQLYFINPNADVSGTTTAWGQYTPIIDPTDLSATTVFSLYGNEGNEAIVNEMMSYAMTKKEKTNEANNYHKKAQEILEGIWLRIGAEQSGYQPYEGEGIWKRFDVLNGGFREDIIKRNQWN